MAALRGYLPPRNHEPQHIRQVVTGIGQQGHRVAEHAVNGFDNDESHVENDPDRESPTEAGRRMEMNCFAARPTASV